VATKAGIVGLTRVLRRELEGSGIHLTLFCPGPTRTFMTERMIMSGRGTAGVHHHGPELPAALMVEAVRRPRRYVITSNQPRRQALIGWVEKLFPRLLDGYWRSQTSDEFFEGAALSGEE
jgi:short-subunit dehydrogenase